jgi:uncharacterized protein
MRTDIIGRGWTMPTLSRGVSASVGGQLITLTDAHNEIEQAIGIILMTAPGERVMRPRFGCRIHDLFYAPNNWETAVQAERYVEDALRMWEPRIRLNKVTARPAFTARAAESGQAEGDRSAVLLIDVEYTIKATKDERSLVFPFYLIPENE